MENEFIKQFENLPEEGKEAVLKKLKYETIITETKHRLKTDTAIQHHLSQYAAHSIDFYITMYAISKANWMTQLDGLESMSIGIDFRFTTKANELLGLILRRKAMQKIADWNAYQADFEGIETIIDFALRGADIFNVPFIEPIEQQEVDILNTA